MMNKETLSNPKKEKKGLIEKALNALDFISTRLKKETKKKK